MKIASQKSLMERVSVVGGGCWIWTGARSKDGYGVARWGDTQRAAPRLFWEAFVGPIPEGYRVRSRKLSSCAGKLCCNPAHRRLQGPIDESVLRACKHGHLLTPDNAVIENRNGRKFKRCRICRREAWRSWQKQRTQKATRPKSRIAKALIRRKGGRAASPRDPSA
jgi:hypothetical protein